MSLDLVRELYEYHWWANRRLWDVTVGLGDDVARRDLGRHFSVPTLKGMFAHVYGADWIWLSRWNGVSPPRLPGDADFADLAALRVRWDEVEGEQRAFLARAQAADLTRPIDYKNTEGKPFRVPLGTLLQHVANHATHHRSEIATMLTMVSASPPPTDYIVHQLIKSGQMK